MNRRRALRVLGAAALGGISGCMGGSGGSKVVEMIGLRFEPGQVSIEVGGMIEWVNESGFGHTVTGYEARLPDGAAYFASGGFASERAAQANLQGGVIGPDGTYTHTFDTVGEHPYYCIPHEGSGMTGVVAVG